MQHDQTDQFLQMIEERLDQIQMGRKPFAEFLEEKMDLWDYSNTSLAKKVFHRVEKKNEEGIRYLPVTRQAIGAWLKGSMPSSREIYISLGMAFHMSLEEINYILLETYMGYGLYCKNIEDALWIAVINGVLDINEMGQAQQEVERILAMKEDNSRSLATTDLWVMLAEVTSMEQFYDLIRTYREEFREGARKFGQCMEEVIEEEYGYYEKASWFLRDIGLLHCEAQFSKIRAGKALVTREWLLRFCIALQPTYASIEKLLSKAQMEPLGVTPVEVILEMIARYKTDTLANSQQIWMMLESVTDTLRKKGYEIEDDLCRKYNSAYQISTAQKWWFSICLGKELLSCEKRRDYGYEKEGYCRYTLVDRLLYDDVNKSKKSAQFRKNAEENHKRGSSEWRDWDTIGVPDVAVPRGYQADVLELEKFQDYCFMRRPSRFSKDFVRNDIYFYSTFLYSLWTGKCWQKAKGEAGVREVAEELKRQNLCADSFLSLLAWNLEENHPYDENADISHMLDALCTMSKNE